MLHHPKWQFPRRLKILQNYYNFERDSIAVASFTLRNDINYQKLLRFKVILNIKEKTNISVTQYFLCTSPFRNPDQNKSECSRWVNPIDKLNAGAHLWHGIKLWPTSIPIFFCILKWKLIGYFLVFTFLFLVGSCNKVEENNTQTGLAEVSPPNTQQQRNIFCEEAASFVCEEIGESSSVCELLRSSINTLSESRCITLLENKAATLNDMRQLEESSLPLSDEKRFRIENGDSPSFGPQDAKVTVTAFVNFHCKECIEMGMFAPKLLNRYPDSVRIVFRAHPSAATYSLLAAHAALAAHAQGKFLEYTDCLYNNQHDLNRSSIERCGKEVSLKTDRFLQELNNNRYVDAVNKDKALAIEVFAGKAPYFFVNGHRISSGDGEHKLVEAIETAQHQSEINSLSTFL